MSALVRTFRGYLDQTLGRAGAAAVFTDHQLDANTLLTPELAARARGAAVLLVVLSPGYLASGWCQGELRQFLEQEAGRRRGRGTTAVVVVERDRVDPGDDPAATRDHLRTQFWEADPDSLRARPLASSWPSAPTTWTRTGTRSSATWTRPGTGSSRAGCTRPTRPGSTRR